jgi:hypothetical protein
VAFILELGNPVFASASDPVGDNAEDVLGGHRPKPGEPGVELFPTI